MAFQFFVSSTVLVEYYRVELKNQTIPHVIGGGTIFKGGGQIFEVKHGALVRIKTDTIAAVVILAQLSWVSERRCAPFSSWRFFWKWSLKWCDLVLFFHHVKHAFNSMFTAGVFCFVFLLWNRMVKKWWPASPPPCLKSGGATGPPGHPSSATYTKCYSFRINIF